MTAHSTLTGLNNDDHPQYLKETDANAKGDIFVATANDTVTRLAVGTNGQVLVADSTATEGVKWTNPYWITSDLVSVDRPFTTGAPTVFTATADATIHTKGGYTELIASTAGAVTMLKVMLSNTFTSTASTGVLVDIATGAGGAEVVVAADLNAGYALPVGGTNNATARTYWLPLAIPSGTRISARCQALITVDTVDVQIQTFSGSNKTGTIDTIGAVSASSRGTNVAGGNNTEGTFTQITASTAAAYTGLLVGVGGAGSTGTGNINAALDIGTGAALSETAIISDLQLSSTQLEAVIQHGGFLPISSVSIPSSTRIAARVQNSSGTQSWDVVLYGLR